MPEEKLVGQFFDVLTGETIVRDLTPEEIAALPKAPDVVAG
jgi:hypothetical protein